MRRADVYPHDAVTGCCFVTGDYEPGNIVDLEVYLDALPPYGRLCLSEKAVRDMVTALGWVWPDPELEASFEESLEQIERLREENMRLRRAVASILRAAKLAELEEWVS